MSDSSHTFEAYYKRATSPLVVLQLLRDGPMYGYELTRAMKEKSRGKFTLSLLYPVLYRLEELGYIRVERTEVVNNRVRSYYALTPGGKDYLARSMEEYRSLHGAFLQIMKEGEQ